jgi:hypothetical protein
MTLCTPRVLFKLMTFRYALREAIALSPECGVATLINEKEEMRRIFRGKR